MDSPMDPASLRAAALSTLKKKGKRPVKKVPDFKSSLPRPPPPQSDSFLLDYGQDEPQQGASTTDAMPVDTPNDLSASTKNPVHTVEDAAMREEGEISEEEEPSTIQPQSIPRSQPLAARLEPAPELRPPSVNSRSRSPEFQAISPVSLIDRIFPVVNKESQHKQSESTSMIVDPAPEIVQDFVRPGVALSQDEYDTIKDIILDLLGWGVPPAAILKHGVSREVMFYVFNELNLQLPEDFDFSGIPPYTPSMAVEPMQSIEPSISTQSLISSTSQTNLPVETTTTTTTDPTLLDMEQQRRKELLARKAAVQASRKNKKVAPITPATSSKVPPTQREAPATPIATEVVEDFLNSIGPKNYDEEETEIIAPPQALQAVPSSDPDAMEVDQPLESKVVVVSPTQESTARDLEEPHDLVSIANESFVEPSVPAAPPPWSGDSTVTTFSDVSTDSHVRRHSSSTRRGTKRPVASDFVDMEPTRYRNDPSLDQRAPKLPRFNNLQSMRCVIELSDDDDSDGEHHTPFPSQPVTPMPFEPRTTGTKDRRIKQQSMQGPAAASILHLKELEIQRMREMIARKEEETRLKKLALASKTMAAQSPSRNAVASVPPSPPTGNDSPDDATNTGQPSVQDDDDGVANVSPATLSSVTPADEQLEGEVAAVQEVDDVDVEQTELASAQAISMSAPDRPRPDAKESTIFNHDVLGEQVYSEYRSPLALYPRLSRKGIDADYQVSSYDLSQPSTVSFLPSTKPNSSSTTSLNTLKLDLQPLKLDVITRSMDPLKRLCQYEIPGPGVCRDKDCEDIHLSKIESLEPDDNETADYIFKQLPHDWANKHQVKSASTILQALQAVRQHNSEVVPLDECVNQAILLITSLSST
ncbi:hypothetical protein CVT24_010679 [Panaeolus cyanescens]|uniref:Zinc-finger domain-containing protein n=1 Tax=Panaeolus cyanescens TaxID=181874 RepID=A0A409YM42_9AGAR|nr:hypothetical protein CVT24_010679 [Panaeolus cyanescens]